MYLNLVMRCVAVATAVSAGVLGGIMIGQNDKPAAAFVAEPQSFVAKVPTLPGFKQTWSGSGTLTVPSQIAAGSYLIGPDDGALGCVWQRLKKADRDVRSIIASGQMSRGSVPQLVVVADRDKFLQLLGGCAFRRVA